MTDHISRAFDGDIEVRADASGRTVRGIFVPWDREARVSDGGPFYREAFQRGSLTKTFSERGDRVKFLSQHDARSNPLGRAVLLREDAAGAYGEFAVSRTQAGDEALELIRDGVLDSFSVGFTPVKHEKRGEVVVRTEVALREVSLVTFPAYEDARVAGIRAALDELPESERAALIAMWATARDLTPATTDDGQSERTHDTTDEPASATPDVLHLHRSLRALARERGILP
jgi:uncharacterized protein